MASLHGHIDWDQLSVGSSDSFFERRHPEHEPLKTFLLKATIEKWRQDATKETDRRQSRKLTRAKRPLATVPPRRGKSAPPKKAPNTIPVTPNVLKKKTMPSRVLAHKPEPYEFKAKPAPSIHKQHKSCGNLNKIPAKPSSILNTKSVTNALSKLTVTAVAPVIRKKSVIDKENHPTVPTIINARKSRPQTRSADVAPPLVRVRSNSAPERARSTVPVTPMVLKRNNSRNRKTTQGNTDAPNKDRFHFKAKPAEVLHRKPFKPKLVTNNKLNAGAPAMPQCPPRPFEFCLESRIKDRKGFNHRSHDAYEKKQKQIEEEKRRAADEQYQAARKLTNFRATRNPFK